MATLVTLPICCMCKRVSSEESPASGTVWIKLQKYLDRHHLSHADYQLTHTYCPACFHRQARAWHLHDLASAPLKRSA